METGNPKSLSISSPRSLMTVSPEQSAGQTGRDLSPPRYIFTVSPVLRASTALRVNRVEAT